MNKPDNALLGFYLFILAAVITMFVGWVANVVWLFKELSTSETWEAVVAIIGVFVPLIGGIHGWTYML